MIFSQFYDIEISLAAIFLRVRDSKVFNTLQADVFSVFPFNSFWWYICSSSSKVCIIYRQRDQKKEKRVFVCLYRLLSCLCNFLFISGKEKYK